MPMTHSYDAREPSRAELERTQGPVLVEFGAAWCGICKAAQPAISAAMNERPEVEHIKVADGRGQPLGRSFGVKLWPTLIGLRDGKEVARLVRPSDPRSIAQLLEAMTKA